MKKENTEESNFFGLSGYRYHLLTQGREYRVCFRGEGEKILVWDTLSVKHHEFQQYTFCVCVGGVPCVVAHGILVPQPGLKPVPPCRRGPPGKSQ